MSTDPYIVTSLAWLIRFTDPSRTQEMLADVGLTSAAVNEGHVAPWIKLGVKASTLLKFGLNAYMDREVV